MLFFAKSPSCLAYVPITSIDKSANWNATGPYQSVMSQELDATAREIKPITCFIKLGEVALPSHEG